MNPTTWREMVKASLEVWEALGDGIKKVEENEMNSRIVQQRSLFIKRDIKKGMILNREDVIPLRPIIEDGIKPNELDKVVGRRICRDIDAGEYLTWEDLYNA